MSVLRAKSLVMGSVIDRATRALIAIEKSDRQYALQLVRSIERTARALGHQDKILRDLLDGRAKRPSR